MSQSIMIGSGPSKAWLALLVLVMLAGSGWAGARLLESWSGRRKGHRGLLHELGWCVALAAIAIMATGTVCSLSTSGANRSIWLVIVAAAVLVLLIRPRLAAVEVAVLLMLYGLAGIALAHTVAVTGLRPLWYGVAPVGRQPPQAVAPGVAPGTLAASWSAALLPEAYAFLIAGGVLAWRQLSGWPAAARIVLGRMTAPDRPAQALGLLLLPIAVAAGSLVASGAWLVTTLVLVAGAMIVIRSAPDVAARLAPAGLIALGLIGMLILWRGHFQPLGAGFSSFPVRYGAVLMSSQGTAWWAGTEAAALLALGCWLAPQAYPELRRLLRPPDAELARRVQRLTESRAVAVDTAAADLRRLERDLHDGAQARLVALGMNLRAAERLIRINPDAAAALIAEARETSARALTELRELVRGVYPPVLADRGLADAIRALALDSPLHVQAEIELAGRPPAPVETACYFAVAEILTNAAKHSGAREGRIWVSHTAGVLRIEVTDFGLGGADPARGSGLAGVEKRLASFDGILAVSSPAGGPTIVVLEVPCALSSPRTSSC